MMLLCGLDRFIAHVAPPLVSGNNSSVIGKRAKSKRIVPGDSLNKFDSDYNLEFERTQIEQAKPLSLDKAAMTPTDAARSGQSKFGFDPAASAKRSGYPMHFRTVGVSIARLVVLTEYCCLSSAQSSGIDPSRFHNKRSKSMSPPSNRHAFENPGDQLVDTEDEAETKRSSRKRRKSKDFDDEEWTSGEEKKQGKFRHLDVTIHQCEFQPSFPHYRSETRQASQKNHTEKF